MLGNCTQSNFNKMGKTTYAGASSLGRDESCSDQPQSAYQDYLRNFSQNNPGANLNEGAPIKQISNHESSYYSSSQMTSSA